MALDFYIAHSIDAIQRADVPVGMSAELQEYIYKNRNNVDYDLKCLYDLDPYGDTVLGKDRMVQWIAVCAEILGSDLLLHYSDIDEAVKTVTQLKEMCEKAIANNQSMISVGD